MTTPTTETPVDGPEVRPSRRSRLIEDTGFAIGIGLIALRGVAELVQEFLDRPNHTHPFPLAFVIGVLACVLPKTLGRMTAGRIWEVLGGSVLNRGKTE